MLPDNVTRKKKFRKFEKYRCCYKPKGNSNKISKGYCCTYPQIYKRLDITFMNLKISRTYDEEPNLNSGSHRRKR